MTRRYLTHFSTIFLMHIAIMYCGVQIIGTEVVKKDIEQRILNLKVASQVLFSAPETHPQTVAPTRKNAPVINREKTVPQTQPAPEAAAVTGATAQEGGVNGVKGGYADGVVTNDKKLIYKAELRALIDENVVYPAVAKRMNIEGVVTVKFKLLADGSITNVSVENSSGNERLDGAGLDAVKKVKRYKAIPSEFATNEMDLSIPIKFKTI